MLTTDEKKRYNRHIILDQIGMDGQERLKAAKVLVIGAGGLGCPVLQYLTAAGIGTIGIVDFDTVDVSNLQRQILFDTTDLGQSKVEVAKRKLSLQNPHINFQVFNERLTSSNAVDIFADFDIIVDGTDNFPTRYLVNDASVLAGKPLVFGSIFKFEGQVSVFNYQNGPTYRCLFPTPPGPGEVPNCAQIGVIGVLPGLIGTIQANEVIKMITGVGDVLSGQLLLLDALTMQTTLLKFKRSENAAITELIDYEDFCGLNDIPENEFEEIGPIELNKRLQNGDEIHLIDVRETHEYDICHLNAVLIPMNTIPENIGKIPRDKTVVLYCHHGMRSAMMIKYLEGEYGFKNLVNLSTGIQGWASDVDAEMQQY